ncbi:MAG: TadE/TadG family type IV pilus assembly protein [Propionivibrio sp.]
MRKLNERGAVAVEFALLLPVLLMILFGIIEFGMIMYGREVVTNASREGARAGIVQVSPKPTSGDITTIATNYLTGTGVNLSDVTISVAGAGGSSPATVTVTATYNYPWLIPYIPTVLGLPSPLPITMSTTMRHE